MQEKWSRVDDYICDLFDLNDPVLEHALETSADNDLPEIQVSFSLGQLLYVLARSTGARRILEVGTLGGFSAVSLARALPEDGVLVSLELEPLHARVATENLEHAGLADKATIVVGPAVASLKRMVNEGTKPFDFIFLDADKERYAAYMEVALALSHPGTLVVADNIVRDGEVVNDASDDPMVRGVRAFNKYVAAHPRLSGTVLQTVGHKGYDGIALLVVEPE